jgi:aspartyl protease family protein
VNGDDALSGIYLLLAMILVASGLSARRLPLGATVKMVIAWVAIFGAGFLLFALRDDFGSLYQRIKSEAIGSPVEAGTEVRIPKGIDDHFWVDAEVNGTPVRFLVDSGATFTTIGRETARRAGVQVSPNRDHYVRTGNGVIAVASGRARTLKVGTIERSDVAMQVADNEDLNVLGMSFLSSLRRWSVEGRWLVLAP